MQGFFLVDLLSTIPWDLVVMNRVLRLVQLAKAVKLLKLVRMLRALKLFRLLKLMHVRSVSDRLHALNVMVLLSVHPSAVYLLLLTIGLAEETEWVGAGMPAEMHTQFDGFPVLGKTRI